ncbi:MAG: YcxB family protein [Flavobacterium sp.]|nr:MAG: YcxB family protein [Flavobacterium sp.]
MKIKTKITFKEYAKLLYSLTYERPVMRFLVLVAMIIVLWILFYYLHIFNLPKPVIYQYLTLGLILGAQPIVIYTTIRRIYKSSNHLNETLEMQMTDEEIKIEGESFYLEVKWERMFRIVEKPHYFLVYQNSLSAIIIPKKDLGKDGVKTLRQIFERLETAPVKLTRSRDEALASQ